MPLADDEQRHLFEYRQGIAKREEAHRRAWSETVGRIHAILAHIEYQNIGLARDEIGQLLGDLPHDFGAQTFFPMFDRKLEEQS